MANLVFELAYPFLTAHTHTRSTEPSPPALARQGGSVLPLSVMSFPPGAPRGFSFLNHQPLDSVNSPCCSDGLVTVAGPGAVWANPTLDGRLHASVSILVEVGEQGSDDASEGDRDLLIVGLSSNCQAWGQTPPPDAVTVTVLTRGGRLYVRVRTKMFGSPSSSAELVDGPTPLSGKLRFTVNFAACTIRPCHPCRSL